MATKKAKMKIKWLQVLAGALVGGVAGALGMHLKMAGEEKGESTQENMDYLHGEEPQTVVAYYPMERGSAVYDAKDNAYVILEDSPAIEIFNGLAGGRNYRFTYTDAEQVDGGLGIYITGVEVA